MNSQVGLQAIARLHSLLLRLYPSGFRDIFEKEMQLVFTQSLQDSAAKGAFGIGRVLLCELFDIFPSVFHERLSEWRASNAQSQSMPHEKLSHQEMLLALAVFLIPIGFVLYNTFPTSSVSQSMLPILAGIILAGSLVGLIKRLPRWSLAYYGLTIAGIVFLFIFQGKAQHMSVLLASRFIFQARDELTQLLLVSFWDGMVWFSLLISVIFIMLIISRIPGCRSAIQGLKDDWTRLSYLFYGSSILALVLTCQAYEYNPFLVLSAITGMAIGAWNYLKSTSAIQRYLALLSGLALAIMTSWGGTWALVHFPDLTDWFHATAHQNDLWLEPGQAFAGLFWMVVVITIPYLFKLTQRTRTPALN
jgi:hypothetical protein